MQAAIYVRVSTDEQNEENQIPPLTDICNRRGYELVKVYREKASAWKSGHQKVFKEMMEDAISGKFKVLVIWALDRITREGPARILQIYKRFEDMGITVISYQEPWTEAPMEVKPILLAVIGFVAEMESKRRSERTKAGIARKKDNGGRVGRKPGSKDTKKRKTDGYKAREARKFIDRYEGGKHD